MGNERYLALIKERKIKYHETVSRTRENQTSKDIVRAIRWLDPPGRFLKLDLFPYWRDAGDEAAMEKVVAVL